MSVSLRPIAPLCLTLMKSLFRASGGVLPLSILQGVNTMPPSPLPAVNNSLLSLLLKSTPAHLTPARCQHAPLAP